MKFSVAFVAFFAVVCAFQVQQASADQATLRFLFNLFQQAFNFRQNFGLNNAPIVPMASVNNPVIAPFNPLRNLFQLRPRPLRFNLFGGLGGLGGGLGGFGGPAPGVAAF